MTQLRSLGGRSNGRRSEDVAGVRVAYPSSPGEMVNSWVSMGALVNPAAMYD